ncbi:Smr-domain-containing protein [Eremomyces bilateralis CBS 781.70]|uniref:Smr-domain-containing protein n=1 Tax=Eremomyces bilateralis CBS 781.70 TaxID=1392243 RepID=A0A6G1GCG8_9PEZI|nr:Smr-domain-containing protein [Eremomyces bilateralis CBS 781.70]KAF1815616.1 Smr-domain-containing protein [Eremomyces bilateralis CBS 781.70]
MAHNLDSFTQLGGRAFNHDANRDSEQEYDRLRDLARREFDRENQLRRDAREAGQRRDYGEKDRLHRQADDHEKKGQQYNKQASEFIFRENNAPGRVQGDEIDLHGQYVQEAEQILRERISVDRRRNQTHLHVIVGKGNHSTGHIPKLRQAVEELLREEGLQFQVEQNQGRLYVNLAGGPAILPQPGHPGASSGHGHAQGGHQQQHVQHSQHHGQAQAGYQQPHAQQHHGQAHQQQQYSHVEEAVKKGGPKLFKALRGCCVVM